MVQKNNSLSICESEMTTKVLLIRPNKIGSIGRTIKDNYATVIPPLGLMYLASALRIWCSIRLVVKILDTGVDVRKKEDIIEKIHRFNPDVVGISSMTIEADRALSIAQCVKKAKDNCKVIFGGPHAVTSPSSILESGSVDFVVLGEGERTICELIECIVKGDDPTHISGIGFLKKGKVYTTSPRQPIENLDDIPFPAWDLVKVKRYTQAWNMQGYLARKYYHPIVTSRGCPFKCIYCHNLFGKKFRDRSPENVVKEMKFLYDTYSIREFHIIDDIFNFNKDRVLRICDLIEKSNMDIRIAFPNGVRGDIIDEEIIKKLKSVGCYSITYAVETASKRLQQLIRKNLNLSKVESSITISAQNSIFTQGFFMIGFPGETYAEMEKTIEFARKSDLHFAHFSQVRPFPNTELGESLEGKIISVNWEDFEYRSDRINLSSVSEKDYKSIYRKAYLEVYLAKKRIETLSKILTPSMFREFYSWVLDFGKASEEEFKVFLSHLACGKDEKKKHEQYINSKTVFGR